MIGSRRQGVSLIFGHAEGKPWSIIRRHIGNYIRLIFFHLDILKQLLQLHISVYRRRISHYVQIIFMIIQNTSPPGILDIAFPDLPFLRHGPVEYLRFAGHGLDLQLRNLFFQQAQTFPHTLSCEAPAYGEKFSGKIVHFLSCLHILLLLWKKLVYFTQSYHSDWQKSI